MPAVSYGNEAPDKINLIIEINRGERNKYEYDKNTGKLWLDRVNGTVLSYPADYGFVPDTLCDDGDPLDALLIIDESVVHGTIVPSRPIGVLNMVDDGEGDEKLICVAADDITKNHIREVDDLGQDFKKIIEHFYTHYKDWKNNWRGTQLELNGWGGSDEAKKVVQESISRAKS